MQLKKFCTDFYESFTWGLCWLNLRTRRSEPQSSTRIRRLILTQCYCFTDIFWSILNEKETKKIESWTDTLVLKVNRLRILFKPVIIHKQEIKAPCTNFPVRKSDTRHPADDRVDQQASMLSSTTCGVMIYRCNDSQDIFIGRHKVAVNTNIIWNILILDVTIISSDISCFTIFLLLGNDGK